MIGKLSGILDYIDNDKIIIDVLGVGYILFISNKTLAKLPMLGERTSLLTCMQVKEDDISLYGFIDFVEKEWFENLITVQGIGPKLALVILSNLEPAQLVNSIINREKEQFKHISGVGPKLAERIFTELTKKASLFTNLNPEIGRQVTISKENNDNINDALIALTNLGYNRNEAANVCRKICQQNSEISINELIKAALKELSNK